MCLPKLGICINYFLPPSSTPSPCFSLECGFENVSVPSWTLCLAVRSLWPHTAGTHWVASCPCLYPLEHSNSTARMMEHFYFHFYFHPSFSQWATVSLSEVCSKSQGWLGVGGGFAGETDTAQCRAPISLPHTMPEASGSGEALAAELPPLAAFQQHSPAFFSPWGR